MEEKKSVFEVLSAINCNEHVEKKKQGNGVELSYLSWAWAWGICKKNYPNAFYTIYESANNIPYFSDGRTCWVKTGVTIEGQEHIEYLPIMDFRNQSIPLGKVTSFDMNKAIQRSLTKALARHGLGLYIYAGEDLPDAEDETKRQAVQEAQPQFDPTPMETPPLESQNVDNLFGNQDMPDTIVDDLSNRISVCKDIKTLTQIWEDTKVLLADRPKDFEEIKKKIAILGDQLQNG